MELTNPRTLFLNDPNGWHWSLTWMDANGQVAHRVESDEVFASQAEARTNFKEREAQLRSKHYQG